MIRVLAALAVSAAASSVLAQSRGTDGPAARIDAQTAALEAAALRIWDLAEVGYQELESSRVLQQQLSAAGFSVEAGVAGMPTAFIARYRRGDGPVLAILAEFDALPGLSQAAVATREPRPGKSAAHACGHNLFGAASVASAIAVKEWLAAGRASGEIRVYGSPAEEGGSGKVYLVRAGLFSDVDATLHWHAADRNTAEQPRNLANLSGKFRFYGSAAHAAQAPDQGRSALDGVEAMNFMVNAMREHVPQATRIHYVITNGGAAPNVVPEFAEVYYYVRHFDPVVVRSVMERVAKAAEGAALGTGTRVEFEQIGGTYGLLPNDTLGRLMDASLREVGTPQWNEAEIAFGRHIRPTLADQSKSENGWREIEQYAADGELFGSTDVGDVSWVTPTVGLRTATWAPGTPAHSWQAAAASGTSIGIKGAVVAAKAIARTAQKLFEDQKPIAAAKAELEKRRGSDFVYAAFVGDRAPPLDYRNTANTGGN
jgi:aminobenzoyl-glutamate utilization protein B